VLLEKKMKFPTWFKSLRKFIKSGKAKSKKGLSHVKKVLKKNGAKLSPKKWKAIKKNIKSGKLKTLISKIKSSVKALRKVAQTRNLFKKQGGKLVKPKFPKWFKTLGKALKKGLGKTKAGVKRILNSIKNHGGKLSSASKKALKKTLKSGKATPGAFRKLTKMVGKAVPAIKKAVSKAKMAARRSTANVASFKAPKWVNKVVNLVKKGGKAMKESWPAIKTSMEKNGFKAKNGSWKWFKGLFKTKGGKKMDKNLLKKLRGKLIKGTPKLRKKFNLHTKKTATNDKT